MDTVQENAYIVGIVHMSKAKITVLIIIKSQTEGMLKPLINNLFSDESLLHQFLLQEMHYKLVLIIQK